VISSRKALCLFSLLSCALTLGASGDDFSFLRLALLPAADLSGPLPLDDPNTDFLASGHSGAGQRTCAAAGDGGAQVRLAAAAVPSLHSALPQLARAGGEPLPHGELNLPLLC
jgi:hypothetical protein